MKPRGDGGLCVVLGAGGFRGLAHVGVLQGLRRARIPIRSLIGSSIGGLVAAFHAGLGFAPDRISESLFRLTTGSLLATGLALRRWGCVTRRARRLARPFLEDLERLGGLRLDRLHHGVERLGMLALDLPTGEEILAATGLPCPVPAGAVALGGASLPVLFPAVKVPTPGRTFRLIDGGLSHSVPVERAFAPPFSASTVVAVDLQVIRGIRERDEERWDRIRSEHGEALIHLRLPVEEFGTIFFRKEQSSDLVRIGELSIGEEVLPRLDPASGRVLR